MGAALEYLQELVARGVEYPDASLLDIVATCPACGWKGNSFIYVSEMDVLEAGNHEPV